MSKPYTLDDAKNTILQIFDRDKANNPTDYVTLSEIYNAFAEGMTFPDIQDYYNGINHKAILLGRAFYMAMNPEGYSRRHQQNLRVLCDANIDESYATDGARQVFGYATHINFENLTHAKDSRVWAYANGRFNMILTKDKAVKKMRKSMESIDLTRCALLRWQYILKNNGGCINDGIINLPVLLHVMDASLKGYDITRLLRKHRDTIYEIYEERVSPIIELHKHKAVPGVHFAEIMKMDKVSFEERQRRDVWVDSWMHKIESMRGRDKKPPLRQEDIVRIRKTLKRAAEHAISMGEMIDPLTLSLKERAQIKKEKNTALVPI